jgi:hypothetical protein
MSEKIWFFIGGIIGVVAGRLFYTHYIKPNVDALPEDMQVPAMMLILVVLSIGLGFSYGYIKPRR